MREHGEYVATDGHGMSGEVLHRLSIFYAELQSESVVVEYDPASGFSYSPRLESDGDFMIRRNEHAMLVAESYMVWRIPPRLPHE
jgi:hypothetical protein